LWRIIGIFWVFRFKVLCFCTFWEFPLENAPMVSRAVLNTRTKRTRLARIQTSSRCIFELEYSKI